MLPGAAARALKKSCLPLANLRMNTYDPGPKTHILKDNRLFCGGGGLTAFHVLDT